MPGPPKPTLKAIATLAGVSQATVSRVLNDKGPVAEGTHQKVLDAVRALGGGAPRPIIGILVPDLSNQFFARLSFHLQTLLLKRGYLPVVLATHVVPGTNPLAPDLFLATDAVGVVHAAVDDVSDVAIADSVRGDLPMVLFAEVRSSGNADFISVDSAAAMLAAVHHLYDLGHEHVAFVEGIPAAQTAIERLRSFLAAAAELSLRVQRIRGGYTFDGGIQAAKQIMAQPVPHRPTAVVAANDEMAFGAIQAFGGAGVDVPGEVSVVGYDNTPFARWTHPSVASVAPHRSALADRAVTLLLRRIEAVAETPSGRWPVPSHEAIPALYHSEGRTSVGPAPQ